MKPGVTLESLLVRVKKEVAEKSKTSEKRKLEARAERLQRQPSIYEREELWKPIGIQRSYEIQICDCCTGKSYHFEGDKILLQHRVDPSARKWRMDKGELMGVVSEGLLKQLPVKITLIERVIPECYDCYSVGRRLEHLFKGN